MRTLPREPWRGSQLCGWQTGYALPGETYCGEVKGRDLPYCPEHDQEAMEEYGHNYPVSDDVVLGDPRWGVRLLWEPYETDIPIEASAAEVALYMGAQWADGA